jgi:hypothetical protein
VASAAGREVIALKRVRVVPTAAALAAHGLTTAYAPNLNPEVATVVRDRPIPDTCDGGIPVLPDPFPARETILCATPGGGAGETFLTCGPAGEQVPAEEHAAYQWFVTGGSFPEFQDGAGNAGRNEPRFDRPAGAFTLWSVVRDGRGGEAWLRSDIGAASR